MRCDAQEHLQILHLELEKSLEAKGPEEFWSDGVAEAVFVG